MNALDQNAVCTKCGAVINSQSESVLLPKKIGITDSGVLMCVKCKSVFTYHLVPGRLTLIENVSSKYKANIEKVKSNSEDANIEKVKSNSEDAKEGFFKKLFKKWQ